MPRHDQIHVLLNPNYRAVLADPVLEGQIVLFIGYAHAQTEREVEILVHEFPDADRQAVIFHAMELGPKYRRYREEHSNG